MAIVKGAWAELLLPGLAKTFHKAYMAQVNLSHIAQLLAPGMKQYHVSVGFNAESDTLHFKHPSGVGLSLTSEFIEDQGTDVLMKYIKSWANFTDNKLASSPYKATESVGWASVPGEITNAKVDPTQIWGLYVDSSSPPPKPDGFHLVDLGEGMCTTKSFISEHFPETKQQYPKYAEYTAYEQKEEAYKAAVDQMAKKIDKEIMKKLGVDDPIFPTYEQLLQQIQTYANQIESKVPKSTHWNHVQQYADSLVKTVYVKTQAPAQVPGYFTKAIPKGNPNPIPEKLSQTGMQDWLKKNLTKKHKF